MKTLQTAFLTMVLGVALSSTASAAILANGSISFAMSVTSYTGIDLESATSITVGAGGPISTTQGTPFACPQPDCTPAPFATIVVINPTTFTTPLGIYSDFIVWGDGTNNTRYSFSSLVSATSSTGPNDLVVAATGTFHDTLGTYADSTADIIMTFNQAGGPPGAISGSGTIDTPATFSLVVPEPATLGLMGSALVGLGLIRRKRLTR